MGYLRKNMKSEERLKTLLLQENKQRIKILDLQTKRLYKSIELVMMIGAFAIAFILLDYHKQKTLQKEVCLYEKANR